MMLMFWREMEEVGIRSYLFILKLFLNVAWHLEVTMCILILKLNCYKEYTCTLNAKIYFCITI
jgi:hypothetical protein